MFEVIRVVHFCYGHRLLHYPGKCRHLHGHNARAEIVIRAKKLDPMGMVLDFDEIKKNIQRWVNREMDHRTLLNRKDPLAKVLKSMGEPCLLLDENPTAENIAKKIFRHARSQKLPVAEVRFWETPRSFAVYKSG